MGRSRNQGSVKERLRFWERKPIAAWNLAFCPPPRGGKVVKSFSRSKFFSPRVMLPVNNFGGATFGFHFGNCAKSASRSIAVLSRSRSFTSSNYAFWKLATAHHGNSVLDQCSVCVSHSYCGVFTGMDKFCECTVNFDFCFNINWILSW